MTRRAQVSDVRVNQAVLDRVIELATRLSHNTGAETPRIETLLGLKGVLDVVEEADNEETLAREQRGSGVRVRDGAAEDGRIEDIRTVAR